MLVKSIFKVNGNSVSEHNRVGDFHHRSFKMQRQKHVFFLCFLNCFLVKFTQSRNVHYGCIKNFTFKQVEFFFQNSFVTLLVFKNKFYVAFFFDCRRNFVAVKIICLHVSHAGFRAGFGPRLHHLVRILFSKFFHCCCRAPVRVSLTKNGVNGRAKIFRKSLL